MRRLAVELGHFSSNVSENSDGAVCKFYSREIRIYIWAELNHSLFSSLCSYDYQLLLFFSQFGLRMIKCLKSYKFKMHVIAHAFDWLCIHHAACDMP